MSEQHEVRKINIEKVRDTLTFREGDQIERESGFGIATLHSTRQLLFTMYLIRIGYQRVGDKISIEALMDSDTNEYIEDVEPEEDPTDANS